MTSNLLHDPDHLISPACNLKEFCYQVMDRDVLSIMETASAEIAYQKKAYRRRTGHGSPRPDTALRRYCDDLQELIRILMNGHVSDGIRDGLVDDLRPLMRRILGQVRFNGNAEQVFAAEAAAVRRKG
jgi:hypothetical protein